MRTEIVEDPERYEEGIEHLLRVHGAELDPLSRAVPQEEAVSGEVPSYAKPYLRQALNTHLIVALAEPDDGTEDRVIGALVFRHCTERDRLTAWTPSAHVTFTLVSAEYRGNGIARALNDRFVTEAVCRVDAEVAYITRETWSENDASRAYLESIGFEEVNRVPDDRGPGVDTLYYARKAAHTA